jgi:hypothetical protein
MLHREHNVGLGINACESVHYIFYIRLHPPMFIFNFTESPCLGRSVRDSLRHDVVSYNISAPSQRSILFFEKSRLANVNVILSEQSSSSDSSFAHQDCKPRQTPLYDT